MYNLISYNFGEKLKQIRKSQKISIEDFAKKIGKSVPTIYKYESNDITPDFYTVLEIANLFKVDLNIFCENETFETNKKMFNNPFNTNILYMYYRGYNGNLAQFEFELTGNNQNQKVYMRNVSNSLQDRMKNLYVGSLETDSLTAYFNFKNNILYNNRFEKLQIILNIKTPSDNKYIGIIQATNDIDNFPTIRKCLITKKKLSNRCDYNDAFDRLAITESEIDYILKNGYWNADISNHQDNAAVYLNE